jgi:hypothetical protein
VTTSLNFRPQQPFHTRIFRAEESPAIPLHLLPSKGCHNADIERTGVLNNTLSFGIDAGRSRFTVDQIHHKTRGRTRSAYEKFQNSCEFSLLPFILAGEWVHLNRTSGRDCDHTNPRQYASARSGKIQRKGQPNLLHQ